MREPKHFPKKHNRIRLITILRAMQSVKGSDDEVAEGACYNKYFSVLLGLEVWRPQTGGLGFSSRVEVKAYLWSIFFGAP